MQRPRKKVPPPRQRRRVIGKMTPAQREQRRQELAREELAQRKALFLAALKQAAGIQSSACNATRTGMGEVKHWKTSDPDFKEAVADIMHYQCDFVESALLKKIKEGDTRAICFYLSYKGEPNGYRHRQGQDYIPTPQMPLPASAESIDPAASEPVTDRADMDDSAIMEAIRIAEARDPGVFARIAKQKPVKTIEAEVVK